ncbi:outer membrane beta-barrel protein [Myroides sp. LJL115]
MKKYIILFLVIFYSSSIGAQNTYSLKGRLVDSLRSPIEAATVYVSKQKDSTLVEYSLSGQDGSFELKVLPNKEELFLSTSLYGFSTFVQKLKDGVSQTIDFGDIVLLEQSNDLEEVIIIAQAAPIRIVKDTLEFNASSFKVRPDANLETLLKELPGVQMDENNNITVNGKPVGEILVNGKPFFSEDGKIALENLPADIVNKIQVTDKKSKTERFTKSAAVSDDASINITIDKDKNKGYFGRVSAGYGSDDRYESALFLNSFTQNTKFSVIGSANNINASGFSMNDVFDNMTTSKSKGGITESRLLGANINQTFNDKLSLDGSYNYSYGDTKNWDKRSMTKFLPDGEFSSDSFSEYRNTSQGQSANVSMDYISDKNALYISPRFSRNRSSGDRTSQEESFDENRELVNKSNSTSRNTSDSNSFSNSIRYIRKFEKEGQFLSLEFNNSNSSNNGEAFYESFTEFFQSNTPNDDRRQFKQTTTSSDSYTTTLAYNLAVNDSLKLIIGGKWNYTQSISDLQVFDFDEQTDTYSILNEKQSNRYKTVENQLRPYTNISWNKKKFSFQFQADAVITNLKATGLYNSQDYRADKNYVSPELLSIFRYYFNKNTQVNFRYNYGLTYQSATQLLAITDLSDPLNTIIGNPDLKPTGNHSFNIGFRTYNFQKRDGFVINIGNSIQNNSIVNYVVYDADRKSTSTYKNISGNYQIRLNSEWFKTAKWDQHTLKFGIGLRYNNSLKKGFIDALAYKAYANVFTPRVYLNYQLGDDLIIKPFYNYTYNTTSYRNFRVDKATSFVHNLGIQTTTYWPKNIVFGNDISYNYNSQIASGFQKDYYMWNVSLAYDFYKSKFRAKVKVYDLLNQNTSSIRTIDPTQIVDSESLVLKQYVMFSLVYNLNAFGKKQARSAMRSIKMR